MRVAAYQTVRPRCSGQKVNGTVCRGDWRVVTRGSKEWLTPNPAAQYFFLPASHESLITPAGFCSAARKSTGRSAEVTGGS
jgi:hypothetical protein